MILFALVFWPVLTFILSRVMPWPQAIIVSIIGGYLLLPEEGGINLPLLPALRKDTIPCLTLLVLAFLFRPGQQPAGHRVTVSTIDVRNGWLPRSTTGVILLALIVTGAIMTALTNGDPLRFAGGERPIQGLRLYDGFSMIVGATALIVPVLLGRKYLAHPDTHRLLLIGLVLAGLAYSLLALIEIRLSPQLNRWVYGFFPHNWNQHVRGGGFRPLVFLNHGLWLAIFFAMTIVAAMGLYRSEKQARFRWLLAAGWLLMTLALSNSLGAFLIALFLTPAILLLSMRLQLILAACIAMSVLTYPFLRGADVVPTDTLVGWAERISEPRSRSLNFRFEQEDQLIEKANDRPLFGWGGFGRNRVYDEFGRDQSVVDGAWVVTIGQGGWVRYIGEFGLLSLPIILMAFRWRRYDVAPVTAALCIVLVANMIDLIPNGTRTPVTWLLVGALLGRLELGRVSEPVKEAARSAEPGGDLPMAPVPISPYTRQSVRNDRFSPS
ncbi:MAG: hypothetical protein AAF415_20350 [Pseudomonadota bacterium]